VACSWRFTRAGWQGANITIRFMPLFLGAAIVLRGCGAIASVFDLSSGSRFSQPSVADAFNLIFYPLCYVAMVMIVRNDTKGMASSTWIDAGIGGLGTAALCSAYLFSDIHLAAGMGAWSTVVKVAYPAGDLLLLAQAAASLALVPKGRRVVSSLIMIACGLNAIGDVFVVFHTSTSGFGAVLQAIVWPISLVLFANAVWIQEGGERRFTEQRTVESFVWCSPYKPDTIYAA
jgi:hypothetical protein